MGRRWLLAATAWRRMERRWLLAATASSRMERRWLLAATAWRPMERRWLLAAAWKRGQMVVCTGRERLSLHADGVDFDIQPSAPDDDSV
jgi:hypothetical protein